jgi:hypothetical protein
MGSAPIAELHVEPAATRRASAEPNGTQGYDTTGTQPACAETNERATHHGLSMCILSV